MSRTLISFMAVPITIVGPLIAAHLEGREDKPGSDVGIVFQSIPEMINHDDTHGEPSRTDPPMVALSYVSAAPSTGVSFVMGLSSK